MNQPETSQKKIRGTHVIIALLIIIALLQVAVLINQGPWRPAVPKPQEPSAAALTRQPLAGNLFATPHPAALRAKTPQPRSFWSEDPFEEFDAMSRHMSNMMRNMFMLGSPALQNPRNSALSAFDAEFSPAVDLEETDKAYVVRSDLPGLEKDKINLTVQNNVLTIEGVRQTTKDSGDPNKGYYAQERSYGSFSRNLLLPGPVDDSKITAEYKNGVLTITLPKASETGSAQKVAIQ